MKWRHWLVWGLLASCAIGLGACAVPEVKKLRAENEALQQQLVVVRDSLATLRDSLVTLRDSTASQRGYQSAMYEVARLDLILQRCCPYYR